MIRLSRGMDPRKMICVSREMIRACGKNIRVSELWLDNETLIPEMIISFPEMIVPFPGMNNSFPGMINSFRGMMHSF